MTKWVSTKWTFGGSETTFHTVEECRYLQSAKNYREANDDEIEWHEAEECGNCKEIRMREESTVEVEA